jgi:hypothetical protein
LQPVLFIIVGAIVVLLVVGWVIALVRKVGGCLIHLLLLAAALVLFLYLGWLFWQRLMGG